MQEKLHCKSCIGFKWRFRVKNNHTAENSEKSTIYIDGQDIPVVYTSDVIVAGGGSAGFAACLAAARNGVRTIIIEREFALGGILTSGLMSKIAIEPYMEGIPTEVMMRLGDQNMALPPKSFPGIHPVTKMTEIPVDPESSKKLLEDMVLEAGEHALVLYGTVVTGVIKDGDTIRGVIIENKNGRQIIEGTVFIDATGDGDLSVQAGASYKIGNEEDGLCSAPTLMFRIGNVDFEGLIQHFEKNPEDLPNQKLEDLRAALSGEPPKYAHIGRFQKTIKSAIEKENLSDWEKQVLTVRNGILMMNQPNPNQLLVNTTRIMGINAIEAKVISDAMIEGRKQCWFVYRFIKNHIMGFENSYLMDTASILGIRETRRIVGDHIHTIEDFKSRRKYADAIVRNTDSVEYHNPKGEGTRMERYEEGEYEEISYSSILVKGLKNLMVIGRCFSADQLALSCNRSIGFCFSMGQAAGTAAAMAVRDAVAIRDISISELQKKVYAQK